MKVETAGELGYCFGVRHAIDQAADYGRKWGKVYSLGTIAHNEQVVEYLRSCGVEPIKPEEMVPQSQVAITAHGSPPWVYYKVSELKCFALDCTCPIVRQAQEKVTALHDSGFDIVIFGDPEHQEVQGLEGWAKGSARFVGLWKPNGWWPTLGKKVGLISQTTQIPNEYAHFVSTLIDDCLGSIEEARVFNTICSVVTQRMLDAQDLAGRVHLMLVVGSEGSANTRNLAQACEGTSSHVHIVQNPDQVNELIGKWRPVWKRSPQTAGVTAGTSTPIEVVEAIVQRLKEID